MTSLHSTIELIYAGWFAKDHNVLRRVGHVLLQLPYAVQRSPRQIIIADDCFQLGKVPAERVVQVVIKSTEKIFGSMFFYCVHYYNHHNRHSSFATHHLHYYHSIYIF